jgi:hypothetical protein
VVLTLDWGEEVEDPHKAKKGKRDDQGEKGESAEQGEAGETEAKPADPNVYVEPLPLREERRRLWLEGRDGALRLAEKGVPFSFGTAGGKPVELLKKVRTLVEAGLSQDIALAALTSTPAAQSGVARRLGAL